MFLFLILSADVWGQPAGMYPDLLTNSFENPALVNPAHIPAKSRFRFHAARKFRTGVFSKIAANYFTAGGTFAGDAGGNAHSGRLILYNEQEGPYINRPRAYLNYGYEIALSTDARIAAGADMGLGGVSFSTPGGSATGSAYLPDGAIGLSAEYHNIYAGASMMQMFNSTLKPLDEIIRLKRYYNFFAVAQKAVHADWRLKGCLLWQLLPDVENKFNAGIKLDYKEIIHFGLYARYRSGMAFSGGLSPEIGDHRVNIHFLYNTPVYSSVFSRYRSMELMLAYIMP